MSITRTISESDDLGEGLRKEVMEAGESGVLTGAEIGRSFEVGLGGGVDTTCRYSIVAVVVRSVLVSRVVVVRVIESMALGFSLACSMISVR